MFEIRRIMPHQPINTFAVASSPESSKAINSGIN